MIVEADEETRMWGIPAPSVGPTMRPIRLFGALFDPTRWSVAGHRAVPLSSHACHVSLKGVGMQPEVSIL